MVEADNRFGQKHLLNIYGITAIATVGKGEFISFWTRGGRGLQ